MLYSIIENAGKVLASRKHRATKNGGRYVITTPRDVKTLASIGVAKQHT